MSNPFFIICWSCLLVFLWCIVNRLVSHLWQSSCEGLPISSVTVPHALKHDQRRDNIRGNGETARIWLHHGSHPLYLWRTAREINLSGWLLEGLYAIKTVNCFLSVFMKKSAYSSLVYSPSLRDQWAISYHCCRTGHSAEQCSIPFWWGRGVALQPYWLYDHRDW